jgi:hypothetical protein
LDKVKILAIGNSFSEDAMYYLPSIAKADGIDTKIVNLFIGGCSIEKHWGNVQSDAKSYSYQENGTSTEKYVSIKEALEEEKWDYIITQQASHDSGIYEVYIPYIEKLFTYVREIVPQAKCLLQQTWAYEKDSKHDCFPRYHLDQGEMFDKLCMAYAKASELVNVELIPCGNVIQKIRTVEPFIYEAGGMSLCRDGFHMHYLYGRYLLAATWYEKIFGKSILNNSYVPTTVYLPEETADLRLIEIIKKHVHEAVQIPAS